MAETGTDTFARRHGLWLGPLIAIPGFLSYFAFFSQWATFRDTPWLNLLILTGAIALSITGLRAAWSRGPLLRAGGALSVVVSAGLTVLLLGYCYGISNNLPDAELAAHDGDPIPQAILLADDGSEVDLQAVAAGRLILVFYRGFW
jgi:hypothetical protein